MRELPRPRLPRRRPPRRTPTPPTAQVQPPQWAQQPRNESELRPHMARARAQERALPANRRQPPDTGIIAPHRMSSTSRKRRRRSRPSPSTRTRSRRRMNGSTKARRCTNPNRKRRDRRLRRSCSRCLRRSSRRCVRSTRAGASTRRRRSARQ